MSNKSFGIHRLSVVGATCAAVAMGGLTAPRAAAQEEQAGLEEIIVTARKREENLQYTPMSITALTADDLARRDISNINRIDEVTPNLIFDTVSPSSGQTNSVMVFIRGVGQLDFTGTTEPGVPCSDGIPSAVQSML
jgi:iron complex outermembrane receptor protein